MGSRSEEHTSELQSLTNLVCRLLLEKKNETHLRHDLALHLATTRDRHFQNVRHPIRLAHEHAAHLRHDLALHLAKALDFFFKNTAPPETYTLPLHDALPI